MAESVTSQRLEVFHICHWPVAGNGRLIAGYRSISDRSYRMVSLGYVSQDLAHVSAVLIRFLQIYGYVSSICTKAQTLLPPLASVIDVLQMRRAQLDRSRKLKPCPLTHKFTCGKVY